MICPRCNATMEGEHRGKLNVHFLLCPGCVEKLNQASLRDRQMEPLRTLAARGGTVWLRVIERVKHVQMFGTQDHTATTVCGKRISPNHRREFFDWRVDDLEGKGICSNCRVAIKSLLEEALAP